MGKYCNRGTIKIIGQWLVSLSRRRKKVDINGEMLGRKDENYVIENRTEKTVYYKFVSHIDINITSFVFLEMFFSETFLKNNFFYISKTPIFKKKYKN